MKPPPPPPPPPPPRPWDREPIGYLLEPRGHGYVASLLRDGDSVGWGTIASGRNQRAVQRRAARAVRRAHAVWAHEHSQPTKRFILTEITR